MFRLLSTTALAVAAFLILGSNSLVIGADYAKQPYEWYGSESGRRALDCILSWQSDQGDWPKNKDTMEKPFTGNRSELKGTFDNGATTGELRVLARAFSATGDSRYKEAFLKGFYHILKAQYANGGWPQYYPLRKGYYTHITFNDNCMVRLLEFLSDVENSEDYKFLDVKQRKAASEAVERGVQCIVKCQIVVNGTPTVWCAQHDEITFAPASARSYELASFSGAESANILTFLMKIKNPSPEVIRSVHAGVAWFESAKLTGIRVEKVNGDRQVIPDANASPLWARFYELETNRPFFCDRDGVPKYDLKEIGKERRNGYAWFGKWGENVANAYAKWPHR